MNINNLKIYKNNKLVKENKQDNKKKEKNSNNDNITESIEPGDNIKKVRKYNSEYRKKLVVKFENIKDKQKLIDIYYIIYNDIGNNFSSNRNGIFINMNLLSDQCIENLIKYIDNSVITILSNNNNEKTDFTFYKFDDVELLSEIGHKFSNQEKHILKRIKSK
jgi:hypothetical protein